MGRSRAGLFTYSTAGLNQARPHKLTARVGEARPLLTPMLLPTMRSGSSAKILQQRAQSGRPIRRREINESEPAESFFAPEAAYGQEQLQVGAKRVGNKRVCEYMLDLRV